MSTRVLAGQVAIITGGGRGIGRAVAETLAAAGASIVIGARGTRELEATAEAIRARGGRVIAVAGDIGDPSTAERLNEAATTTVGPCDILINAAAIGGPVGAVETLDLGAWQDTFRINVTGTFLACRAIVPGMKHRRRGRIINVASGLAERVQTGQAAYSATKAAVVQFSRVLAAEVAEYGILVNAVHPGIVRTTMVDDLLSRPAEGVHRSMVERLRNLDEAGGIIEPGESAAFFLWMATECTATGEFIRIGEHLPG